MDSKDFEGIYNEYKAQSVDVTNSAFENAESNLEQIVAVRKNKDGDLIAFKTNSGRELDYIQAIDEAKEGSLAHVDVFHKYGRDILRSEPDGTTDNNLDNMPEF